MKKYLINKIKTKKEAILAIAIGLIGIFLVGTGILAYQKSLKRQEDTLRQDAEHAIAMSEKQIKQTKDYGLNVSDQEKLLSEAITNLNEKHFLTSQSKANQGRTEAKELYDNRLAKEAKAAWKYITAGTADQALIKQAKAQYYRGHYRQAISLLK